MLDLESIDSREDFKWEVINKAYKDDVFLATLRNDPVAAVKTYFGDRTPEGLGVTLHQEKPDSTYFLVNYNPSLPAGADLIQIGPTDNPEEVMVKKAWKDPAYRKTLLSEPQTVWRQEFGGELPDSTKLTVLEESRDTLQIILPAGLAEQKPGLENSDLSEAELDNVSGGSLALVYLIIKRKIAEQRSNPSTNSGSCGCVSASGVRG